MTPQETKLLQDFLSQLVAAGNVPKDRDADAMIQRAGRDQADALYLLVQRALIQQQALEVAQSRITELERAANAAASAGPPTSFLGGDTWGRSNRSPVGDSDRSLAREGAALRGSATAGAGAGAPRALTAGVAPAGGAALGAAPSRWAGGGSGAGGFLGQAAAVAAGVAGGAFLFQGIGSLLGQHGEGSGFLNPGGLAPSSEKMASNEDHRGGDAAGDVPANALDEGDPALRDASHEDQGGNTDGADANSQRPGGRPRR